MEYELICGLETHVELATASKLFCGCAASFGGEPNTRCCPVCLGLPGALPRLNRRAVGYAVRTGLALNARVMPVSRMARKNYTYPDLPKAYQITQYAEPICRGGGLRLFNGRVVPIERIQIEEDAGKLIRRDGKLWVDYNRAGVPLLEIVSLPAIYSAEEARDYMERMQQLVRAIGVSDGRMQEGSIRCDVNVSVRPKGSTELGARTEIKNMNSPAFMVRAINYEYRRQVEVLRAGGAVVRETRRYVEQNGTTAPMRGKEAADDYRFFPEPDLPPIFVTAEELEAARAALPELPDDRCRRFVTQFGLTEEEAGLLVRYRRVADYFEEAAGGLKNPSLVARWLLGPVYSRMSGDAARENFAPAVSAAQLHELAGLVEGRGLSTHVARQALEKMLDTGEPCRRFLTEQDFAGLDSAALREICRVVLARDSRAAAAYRQGKERALQALLGAVMRETRGRAEPAAARQQLLSLLRENP